MHDSSHDPVEEINTISSWEQELGSEQEKPEREMKPLPESIAEYVQKARDELKDYEEHKKFYETRRKKEIILDLATLLEEYRCPRDLLRSIIARELGDYISTRYIEKILAEKYPKEKNVMEESTGQIANSSRNDEKIPIEVSSTGESVIINDVGKSDNNDPYLHEAGNAISDIPTEIKTAVERQEEQYTEDIVRALQTQVKDLQKKCSQFEELANESLMRKEKVMQLQKELKKSKSNEMKIIKGKTEIEFGRELLPAAVEYNPTTKQFSAWIPQEIVERVIAVLRSR